MKDVVGPNATDNACPGCGAQMEQLTQTQVCPRCEYDNLASGRYHYCGERSCYCRNLPGLGYMFPKVRRRFISEHQARVVAASDSQGDDRG